MLLNKSWKCWKMKKETRTLIHHFGEQQKTFNFCRNFRWSCDEKTGRINSFADSAYIESNLYEKDMSYALYLPQTSTKHEEGNSGTSTEKRFTGTPFLKNSPSENPFCPTFNQCNVTINNNFYNQWSVYTAVYILFHILCVYFLVALHLIY